MPPMGGKLGGVPPLFVSSSEPDVKLLRPIAGPSFGGVRRAARWVGAPGCPAGLRVGLREEETPAGSAGRRLPCGREQDQRTMPSSFCRMLGSMCCMPFAYASAERTMYFQSMAEHGA